MAAEERPAGLRDSIGLSWLPEKPGRTGTKEPTGKATNGSKTSKAGFVGCHVGQFGKSERRSPKRDDGEWNEKTKWQENR